MPENSTPSNPKNIKDLKNSFADKYIGKNTNTLNTIKDLRQNGVKEAGKAAAEFAAEKAIQTGLASVGVPPGVSKVLAKPLGKLAIKGAKFYIFLIGFLIGSLIFALLGAGGFLGFGSPDIKKTELANDIPSPYLEAYEQYSQLTGIPWTIYAAIGRVQTDNGRISPYDNIIRDDKGFVKEDITAKRNKISSTKVYTTNNLSTYDGPSAIKSMSKKIEGSVYKCEGTGCGPYPVIGENVDEAKGPFLLLPSASKIGSNPNTLEGSLEIISDILFETMDKVSSSRPNGYGQDKDTSVLFWQQVLNEITPYLGTPGNASTDCADISSAESSYQLINEIWTCEILKSKIFLLNGLVSNPDGTLSYNEINSQEHKNILIDEALSVSYNYSNWENSGCSNDKAVTGVFPLTKQQAKKYNIDRCKQNENISVAAKLVLEGESKSPGQRNSDLGPYQPLANGWALINGALGDVATKNNFYANGPHVQVKYKPICVNLVDDWLVQLVKNDTVFNGANEKIILDKLKLNLEGKFAPINDKKCFNGNKKLLLVDYIYLLAQEISILENTGEENFGLSLEDESNLLLLNSYISSMNTKSFNEPVYGVDSSVNRLSVSDTYVTYPIPTDVTVGYGNPIINSIINLAIEYGGLFDGDDATGANLGQPIGVTYLRDHTLSGSVPLNKWSSNFAKANFSKCGYNGNSSYKSRPAVVAAWEPLCRAAEMAHVNLIISDAYRTNEMQKQRRIDHGDLAAEPAKSLGNNLWSGGSPHEKGLAIDVNVGYSNPQTIKSLKFLHNIVGCYDEKSKKYTSFPEELDFLDYANDRTIKCPGDTIPINRANTYGFVFYCFADDIPSGKPLEKLNSKPVIECPKVKDGGRWREMWHMQLGIPTQTYKVITDSANPLKIIRNTFPIETWASASSIAKESSDLNPDFKALKNKDHDDLVGLFALPLNETTKNAYLLMSGDSGITTELLGERLKDAKTNVSVAYQLWLNCDFNVFSKGSLHGFKSGCNNANEQQRYKLQKLEDPTLPLPLVYALNNYGKPYDPAADKEKGYDEISFIAYAYSNEDFLNKKLKDIFASTTKIEKSEAKPGDMIVFSTKTDIEAIGIIYSMVNNQYVVVDPKLGVTLIKNIKKYRNSTNLYYRRY